MTRRQPRPGAMTVTMTMLAGKLFPRSPGACWRASLLVWMLVLVAAPGRAARAGQATPAADAPAAPDDTPTPAPDDIQIEPPAPPPPGTNAPATEAAPVAPVAPAPPAAVAAAPAGSAAARVVVTAKYSAEIYGFVEFDTILDSTQALNETPGNSVLSKTGSFAGGHSRLTFTGRNSRIGLKLKGPESQLLRTSAILEMDFLGNQPSPVSEAALFTNPTFRFRHMALKMETPALDILAGQYWELFGWQSYFHPNTVEIQGVPAEIYSRALQLRVSHAFKGDAATLELAVAASRPPQRDGALPDTQAGIRLVFNHWKALHTGGSTGTASDPGGIGISGVYRHFRVDELSSSPTGTKGKDAGGISIDVLIPIIPATLDHREDALTFTGSFVQGTGIADLYTGLNGNIGYPSLPNPNVTSPAPTYTPNIDPGLVTYSATGQLHSIDWRSFIVGLQYYLPPSGHVWLSANFSMLSSHNIDLYATGTMASAVFKRSQWADGNIFVDLNAALRLGFEGAWFSQKYVDDSSRKNYRLQASAFYLF
jgi:hypothetical protein